MGGEEGGPHRSHPPFRSPAQAAPWPLSSVLPVPPFPGSPAPPPHGCLCVTLELPPSLAASSHKPDRNRCSLAPAERIRQAPRRARRPAGGRGRGRGLFLVRRLTQARRGHRRSPPPTHLFPASVISKKIRGRAHRPHPPTPRCWLRKWAPWGGVFWGPVIRLRPEGCGDDQRAVWEELLLSLSSPL